MGKHKFVIHPSVRMNRTYMAIGMQKLTFNTKIGNQMQNLYCRNVRNVKFPKIVAEKFAFYMLRSFVCVRSMMSLSFLQPMLTYLSILRITNMHYRW